VLDWHGIVRRKVACFAAHPDDETIGAGGQLAYFPDAWIVHATDGAPHNMTDASAHGFATREAYASARRSELLDALRLAGIPAERALTLGFADQECSRNLVELARRVLEMLDALRPEVVLAPSYEGGHPDHDSLAFAVRAACRLQESAPKIVEYALYHGQSGFLKAGEFLQPCGGSVVTVPLSGSVARLKCRMLECFSTQRDTLALLRTAHERFRPAPEYDFTAPPHQGALYYEHFDWGVTGAEWRDLARAAACDLGAGIS